MPNVWLGVSVEDQKTADERIPLLLQTPAAVRWTSAEPLLGPVDLTNIGAAENELEISDNALTGQIGLRYGSKPGSRLDWVVVGGESGGSKARPMHPDWAYSLQDQCKEAEVPFFFKQWGEWVGPGINGFGTHPGQVAWIDSAGNFLNPPPPDENADCLTIKRVGKKVAGRLLGGKLYDEYPDSK